MDCNEFNKLIDSYLGNELLVETNHDVLRHLENCGGCRDKLSERRALRERVRTVIRNSPEMTIGTAFSVRLRSELQQAALAPGFFEKLVSAFAGLRGAATAFACVTLIVIGTIYLLRPGSDPNDSRLAKKAETQNSTIESNKTHLVEAVRAAWTALSEQAVEDHKNCAIKFNLAEKPISLDEAAETYGPFNKDLDKPVMAALASKFSRNGGEKVDFLEAHSCVYNGRRFTHLVVRQKGVKISIVVTSTDLPADIGGGESLSSGSMTASGFRVGRYAVFVVSELPAIDNAAITNAVEPAIRRQLKSSGV